MTGVQNSSEQLAREAVEEKGLNFLDQPGSREARVVGEIGRTVTVVSCRLVDAAGSERFVEAMGWSNFWPELQLTAEHWEDYWSRPKVPQRDVH